MAVSDLTNTKWLFNNEPTMEQFGYLYLNFSSNNTNYTGINIVNASRYIGMQYDLTDAYIGYSEATSSTGWQNEAYKTIEITGGTDVTNANLISWLEANATQQTAPTGKTQIGTRTITKKMLGTREITKEVVNGVVVYEKQAPSTTISFTIDGTTYQADDGMTWAEWADSAYNIHDYIIIEDWGTIAYDGEDAILCVGYVECSSVGLNDAIQDNRDYVLFDMGECGGPGN